MSSCSASRGPAACDLLTAQQVAASLGRGSVAARSVTSDSGPPGVSGCWYSGASGRALVEVWALRRGAAEMYARMHTASAFHDSITVNGGQRFTTPQDALTQSAFLFVRHEYVNIVVMNAANGVAVTHDLAADVQARLH